MSETIIFDDPEMWVLEMLRSELPKFVAEVPYLGVQVPTSRPGAFITVRADGGSVENSVLSHPRISVNVWGSSEKEASDFARLVSAVLRGAPLSFPVSRVVLVGGPSVIVDAQPRRLMIFELTMRGIALEPMLF